MVINNGFLICYASLNRTQGEFAVLTFPISYTNTGYSCLTGPKGMTGQNGYIYWTTENLTINSISCKLCGNYGAPIGSQISFAIFGY